MDHTGILSPGHFWRIFYILVVTLAAVTTQTARADSPKEGSRTLSPYFFVKSGDAQVDQLPLKSTHTEVTIAGVIADVTVTQTYTNNGKTPLEANYVFPASTRAAVNGMKMTIGNRTVIAQINKREEARKQYEQAKQQGKSASLLEQQRPNVFEMNLANIMPGDEIQVEMRYTELIVPEDGVYEFVYPTVVGPRYSNKPENQASPSDKWIVNPTLRQGESPTSTFDINVNIAAGMPISEIASNSHKINTQFNALQGASIRLSPEEQYGGNRDFTLRYRLDGNKIETGLLLYRGEPENHFLLTMQPPKRVTPEQIPGREYIFIVDISGSMWGFPLETSKELLRNLIGGLREKDRFNVLLFAGSNSMLAEQSLPATQENIAKALEVIDKKQGSGGTELLPAVQRALSQAQIPDYSRTIVIATDGYVDIEEKVFELIRDNLNKANVFTFGIGTSVNRHVLEGMARVGMGEPFVIAKAAEAKVAAERFRKMVESPVLTGIKVQFDGFNAYDVEPAQIPDIMSERPLVLFGKWRGSFWTGKPTGRIVISGRSGNGDFNETVDVEKSIPSEQTSALAYLWARHRIAQLSDFNLLRKNDQRVEEITSLGLKHSLLTNYTSFVAIDSEIRNTSGDSTAVRQPLPLPEGVSERAVGQGYAASRVPLALPSVMSARLKINGDVFFESNKSTLTADGRKTLEDLVARLRQNSRIKLEVALVVGHTDRLENAQGQRLSEQRANAVKDYLVSQGLEAKRIYTEGKANKWEKTKPDQCKNMQGKALIACLQPDRRAEIEIIAISSN